MKRIGYDSDEGRYYFRDSDGSIWRGAEGTEYGELSKGMSPPQGARVLFKAESLIISNM